MNVDKLRKKIEPMVPPGETVIALTKAVPRGAAHEIILGAAGAVGGATAAPVLAGAGGVLGSTAGQGHGDAGRAERAEADLDVGRATNVLLVATDQSVMVFALSGLGRPKEAPARLDRSQITSVGIGEARLFGQKMMEIVVVTATGAEAGFGVAKVHRRYGQMVVEALSTPPA